MTLVSAKDDGGAEAAASSETTTSLSIPRARWLLVLFSLAVTVVSGRAFSMVFPACGASAGAELSGS